MARLFSQIIAVVASFILCLPCFAYLCDMETSFTPFDNGTQTYLDYLGEHCKYTLYVADYTFTSQPIADEYCRLATNGVHVSVILDKSETLAVAKEKALIDQMRAAGVEVVVTTSPEKSAIMHCKFSVLDGQWVITGSFNYTPNADFQCNTLEYNIAPCALRGSEYFNAWQKIYSYATTVRNTEPYSPEAVESSYKHKKRLKHARGKAF